MSSRTQHQLHVEVSLAKKQELVSNISLPKETLAICPVCGDPRFALVFTKEDANFGGLLQIVQCGGCSLVYLNPRLTPEASNNLEDQSAFYRFPPETIEQKIGLLMEMVLSLEKFSPRRGRLLDIGCNRGLLLEAARRVGWQVVGVEPSLTAAGEARANFGLEIYGNFDDVLALEPFDMVIAWYVLEHTYEPVEFLRQSAKVLCPDGVLALQVPSFEYLEEFERRGSITELVCAVHNFYFTPTTLRLVLKKAGLEPVYLVSQPSDLALTAVCRKQST